MTPFKPYADRAMAMLYYQVPAGVLEDGEELAAWVRASVRAAERARAQQPKRRR